MERRWWVLLAVCIGTFMLLLDITVVNVALPDIQRSLAASFNQLQWVVDAYALTLAAFMLNAGGLADRIGRKRIFISGLVLFTVASLGCGLAPTATWLDLARGFQGIGGAAMFATSLALLAQEFHGRERGTAFGLWGATIGAAVAVGPLVGGVLTEAIDWRWIFFVNLPIGAFAVVLSILRVHESHDPLGGRIDWLGMLTFGGGLFALTLALIRGNSHGWGTPPIVALLAGSVALLVGFLVAEHFSEHPMLELSLFRKPAFVAASVAAITVAGSAFAMFLYETLYLQDVLGFSPLQTGLRFLPVTVLAFLVAPISGRLSAAIPMRFLIGAGLSLVGIAFLLMHGVEVGSSWTTLLLGFVVLGVGVGTINPPLASAAVSVVPPRESGAASGINNTFRQVGIASGVAGLGAVFESHVPAGTLNAGTLAAAERSQFVAGLNELFLLAAVIALAGAVVVLALMRSSDFVVSTGGEGAA